MKRTITIISIFLLINSYASASYVANNRCSDAWGLLMDFQFNKAKELISEELIENPKNYYAYYLDQNCDAYSLLMNSNEEMYENFLDNYYERREIMDGKFEDSPYYLSCKAEMELQAGIFNIIYGDRLSGLRKAYSSYKNTYRNLENHPEFQPSLKLDGFFNVAIDNLPPFVKWAVSAFGVTGNTDYGFDLLKRNYENQKDQKGINAESALFVILAAKLNKSPEMVYNFTRNLDTEISNLFVLKYFAANIAYRSGKNEEALKKMQEIDIENHSEGEILYDYMMGKILLRKLDYNAAHFLSRYINSAKKTEYIKEITYKLAVFYLTNNDMDNFKKYKQLSLETGNDLNERDREAIYDANLDYIPSISLTRARLLLEGGYLNEYASEIESFHALKSKFLPYTLEYLFLQAKAAELKNDTKTALKNYVGLIDKGKNEDYYFASEASLRCGLIMEAEGEKESAIIYYNQCLKLYNDDFYEYIEDKAKKGLKRLEK
ncbi:MAG: hypothetical protein C0595_11495 [Marinilabiliales bacterium]|nr:MAG: hypothetical protein C0595_11495 [Marinilabiliales bacterium]